MSCIPLTFFLSSLQWYLFRTSDMNGCAQSRHLDAVSSFMRRGCRRPISESSGRNSSTRRLDLRWYSSWNMEAREKSQCGSRMYFLAKEIYLSVIDKNYIKQIKNANSL